LTSKDSEAESKKTKRKTSPKESLTKELSHWPRALTSDVMSERKTGNGTTNLFRRLYDIW
jgi:hypothetical protein